MIGEWFDSMVSIFAPATAARMAHARTIYKATSQRSYDAARQDRSNSSWVTSNKSADAALLGQGERVRDRARDLIRNNAYARGALDAIVANVVGCGIIPRPALDDDEQNRKISAAWDQWCEHADSTGRLHFTEIQSLACREMVESGECLVHYVSDNDPFRVCPLALELIESERISSERDSAMLIKRARTGNEIRRGVELDSSGKAVGYWLYPTSPNGIYSIITQAERLDARDALHLFRLERIGQTRGVSWLAPAILWLRDLGIYVENELQASAVASCFSVVIKTVDGGESWGGLAGESGAENNDTNGNRFERLEPAQVAHLMPGEDIEIVNPSRPNGNADPWIALILRSIAVAMGISYELVSRDYSRTNYSSNRASALEDRRRFRPMQNFLIWHLCQPVYKEFFASCVMNNVDGFPSMAEFVDDPRKWLKCNWRTPGWEWVDPLKEVQAATMAVEELFMSHGDVIESSFGGDLRETWGELEKEEELRKKLKLLKAAEKAPPMPAPVPGAPLPPKTVAQPARSAA
jgi:lambda family phage portal protein